MFFVVAVFDFFLSSRQYFGHFEQEATFLMLSFPEGKIYIRNTYMDRHPVHIMIIAMISTLQELTSIIALRDRVRALLLVRERL